MLNEKYIYLYNEESVAKYSSPSKKISNVDRIKKFKRATNHIEKLYQKTAEKDNVQMFDRKFATVYNPVYEYMKHDV